MITRFDTKPASRCRNGDLPHRRATSSTAAFVSSEVAIPRITSTGHDRRIHEVHPDETAGPPRRRGQAGDRSTRFEAKIASGSHPSRAAGKGPSSRFGLDDASITRSASESRPRWSRSREPGERLLLFLRCAFALRDSRSKFFSIALAPARSSPSSRPQEHGEALRGRGGGRCLCPSARRRRLRLSGGSRSDSMAAEQAPNHRPGWPDQLFASEHAEARRAESRQEREPTATIEQRSRESARRSEQRHSAETRETERERRGRRAGETSRALLPDEEKSAPIPNTLRRRRRPRRTSRAARQSAEEGAERRRRREKDQWHPERPRRSAPVQSDRLDRRHAPGKSRRRE